MAQLTPEMNAMLTERFGRDTVLALATAEQERPHVRYVNMLYEDGAFYVITYGLSGKMQQIARNPNVALAGEWFTAHGTAESLGWVSSPENAALLARLRQAFALWIDNGHTNFSDPNTIILRITLNDGLLFSHGTPYTF